MPLENLNRSSKNVLNRYTARHIQGDSLFARLGRTVCEAECLPRKEFFEAWEVARRTRRKLKGGRIVELAAGHGLLSAILLLLDGSSPNAICVDIRKPVTHERLMSKLVRRWPQLEGRITYTEATIEETTIPDNATVCSVHACGRLTDQVLDLAMRNRAPVAVLPCCQDLINCDTGSLTGWVDGPLAVDLMRAVRLQEAGYQIHTATIPKDITPKNRLLLGLPMTS